MKCHHCEKPATFHITELTEPSGPHVLHLCEEHAKAYLSQEATSPGSNTLAGMLAQQLKLDQSAEQIAATDSKTCPVCGITFAEFRNVGRLGCAYDYVCFQNDLEPLLINIHGAKQHKGKSPHRTTGNPDRQHRLKLLRNEMKEAIEKELYEKASVLRDQIRELESEDQSS